MSNISSTTRPTTTRPADTSSAASGAGPAPGGIDDDTDVESLASNPAPSPAEQRALSVDVTRAETDIRRTLMKSVLRPQDTDVGVASLLRLPPADVRDVVMKMADTNPDGLERIFSTMSPAKREALATSLSRAGVLQPTPPMTTTVSPTAPQPPPGPSLIVDDPSLPAWLRDFAQARNIDATTQAVADFAAYREQYGVAVDAASSVATLRGLGPMASPPLPSNLPTVGSRIEDSGNNRAYQAVRGDDVPDLSMTTRIQDKLRALTGRAIAGLSLSVSGRASMTLSNVTGAGGSIGVSRGADGTVTPSASASLKVGGATVAVDNMGGVTGGVAVGGFSVAKGRNGVEVGTSSAEPAPLLRDPPAASAKGPAPSKVASGITIDVGHVGVKAGVSDIGVSVDVDNDRGLSVAANYGFVQGQASYNGDGMGMGGGISKRFGDPDDVSFEVGIDASFFAQGVTTQDRAAFVSTSEVGFYDTPSELAEGKPWSKLSDETRATYELQGWSTEEWRTKSALSTALIGRR